MELRLYSFVSFYISAIQHGIQTGHAAVDLVRKYRNGTDLRANLVSNWSDNWKTFIILNGGDLKTLVDNSIIFVNSGFPWIRFYESKDALGGILTCTAAVLHEQIFDVKVNQTPDADGNITYTYIREPTASLPGAIINYDSKHRFYPLINLIKRSKLA